jgi:hypothetical protein
MILNITKLCHYAKCHCAECSDLFIGMLNVVILSVVRLSVVAPCFHNISFSLQILNQLNKLDCYVTLSCQ